MPVKGTRTKKTEETTLVEETAITTPASTTKSITKTDPFILLIQTVTQLQVDFEKLQKEISQTKENWILEQKTHQKEMEDYKRQQELERKREQESYEYDLARRKKQAEDNYSDQKDTWDKWLKDQKESIEKEKLELEELRKRVTNFETEKSIFIKEAQNQIQKELTEQFENNRKLREQEIKSQQELLNLKLTNLLSENSRQATEIQTLKKALEEATQQVKEIAVKVIESGSNSSIKTSSITE